VVRSATILCFFALFSMSGATEGFADPIFYSTSTPSAWTVSVNVAESFDVALAGTFLPAVAVTGRPDFIANNSAGTNTWWTATYFIFRQTVDLTGYDPTTAVLRFQWGCDDVPNAVPFVPAFKLNSGSFQGTGTCGAYGYGGTVSLSGSGAGFVAGLNTLDFYVEGNGVTDGFELQTASFTARENGEPSPVPEPASVMLLGTGLVGLRTWRKRRG
jgi:hypothetical protein